MPAALLTSLAWMALWLGTAAAQAPPAPEPAAPVAGATLPVPPPRDQGGPFLVAFQLRMGGGMSFEHVEVQILLPEGVQAVRLVDDGSVLEDMALDGVYTGTWRGPLLRFAQVRLLGGSAEAPMVLAESFERFADARGAHLAWRLVPGAGRLAAVRTAASPHTGADDVHGRVELLASFGWAALLLLYAGVLAFLRRRRRG